MNLTDLHRAVADVTGETLTVIRCRGFQPLQLEPRRIDPEDLIIDWDDLELQRNVAFIEQRFPMVIA